MNYLISVQSEFAANLCQMYEKSFGSQNFRVLQCRLEFVDLYYYLHLAIRKFKFREFKKLT